MAAFQINSKCTSCNACLPLCPSRSIYVGFNHYVIDPETCDGSMVCLSVCPESAIVKVSDDKYEQKREALALNINKFEKELEELNSKNQPLNTEKKQSAVKLKQK